MAKAKMGTPTDREVIKVLSEAGIDYEKAKAAYEKSKTQTRNKKGVMDEAAARLAKLAAHAEEPELFNQPDPEPEPEDDEDFDE